MKQNKKKTAEFRLFTLMGVTPWRHLVLKVANYQPKRKIASEIYSAFFETRSLCFRVAKEKKKANKIKCGAQPIWTTRVDNAPIFRQLVMLLLQVVFYFVCTPTDTQTHKTLKSICNDSERTRERERERESVKPKIAKLNWKEAWSIACLFAFAFAVSETGIRCACNFCF